MPSVECSAPCAYRSYNKYREPRDRKTGKTKGYVLSTLPGAAGPKGTCQHGTAINIGKLEVFAPINPKFANSRFTIDEKTGPNVWKPEFWVCQNFKHWDTLLNKPQKTKNRSI